MDARITAWWDKVYAIMATLGPDEYIEAWQGPGGYDGEPVIKYFHGDSTVPVKREQPHNDGFRRSDDGHPRRGEVTEWLAKTDVAWSDFLSSLKVQSRNRPLSAKQIDAAASAMDKINARAAARQEIINRPVTDKVTEDGMYQKDGVIYKVQRAVHGSGQLYAKVLIIDGPGSAHFEYAQGAIKNLTASDRMSLKDAQAFGHLYGVCCQCGKTLTDETSISNGIGPVCARKL